MTARTADRLNIAIANIEIGHASQLRISIESWRGSHKVELRQASAAIPGFFFPTAAGVMLDIEQLPALIEALQAAEVAARRRGWLP